jgi:lipoprotein-releasing system permease protein
MHHINKRIPQENLMPISLLFALRFLRSSRAEKNISIMVKICFLSIFISTFALTLAAAIMKGFQKATHDKLQSINADIVIQARGQVLNFNKLSNVLKTEFDDSIAAFSPLAIAHAIVQNTRKNTETTTIVELRGIDPIVEPQVSALKDMITATDKQGRSWAELLKGNYIFIGQTLAQQLGTQVGGTITLLFQPEEAYTHKITLESQEVIIAAFFKTGIQEFDEHVLFCSLDLFKELFDAGITQVTVKLKHPHQDKAVVEALRRRLSLEVYSWKDLYQPLISALTLEKYAIIIVLALIILIASMNMISLLFMYVTRKQSEIALLKAMSMTDTTIIMIFLLIGSIIALSASVGGILLASIVSWVMQYYPLIKLPDVYYATYLPVQLDWSLVIIVLCLTTSISFLAALLPAYTTRYIRVAQVLKGS